MFIRAIIFTAFNGFEKVTTTDKRRLAKVLNALSKDINSEAKATIKSLDHVYRSEIFNTESPESMQRLANLRADLKKVAADGVNIRMNVIDEKTFVENGGNHFKAVQQGCNRAATGLHLQPRSEHNTGADMRTLLIATIGFGLIIVMLYLSLQGLSSTIAKYDYCYDAVMAAKYDLPKPDFTEYGLKSEPECKK